VLPVRTLERGDLLQHVSRTIYRDSALHFGQQASNRYDPADRSYGVLYLAHDLATALMESLFHDHRWSRGTARTVSLTDVRSRLVRLVEVRDTLALADLTADGVMAAQLGLTLEELVGRDYVHTRDISRQVHSTRAEQGGPFDGIFYPSRNNARGCTALFDRARDKVRVHADLDLDRHADWPAFVAHYQVGIIA
jgi:hypothetical protein